MCPIFALFPRQLIHFLCFLASSTCYKLFFTATVLIHDWISLPTRQNTPTQNAWQQYNFFLRGNCNVTWGKEKVMLCCYCWIKSLRQFQEWQTRGMLVEKVSLARKLCQHKDKTTKCGHNCLTEVLKLRYLSRKVTLVSPEQSENSVCIIHKEEWLLCVIIRSHNVRLTKFASNSRQKKGL